MFENVPMHDQDVHEDVSDDVSGDAPFKDEPALVFYGATWRSMASS